MTSPPKPTLRGKLSVELARKHDPRVRTALQLLAGSASPLSLEEAGRFVNLSGSRLRHIIRQEIGVPLHVYIKQVRLCHARELLEDTFLTVKEIVSVAGFTDRSHFSRDYKMAFGETPSQTRRKFSHIGQ